MKQKLTALLIPALWLALVSEVGAQAILLPGEPNVWGTQAALTEFQTVRLPAFKASLVGLTWDQLNAKRDALLAGAAKVAPGTKEWTETTIYEAAIRAQMNVLKPNPAPFTKEYDKQRAPKG